MQPEAKEQPNRRQRNAPGGRTKRYRVGVTPEQDEQLIRMANSQGVTVPRLLTDTTLNTGPRLDRLAFQELSGIHRTIRPAHANLNQVARAGNSGAYDAEAHDHAVQLVIETNRKLQEVLDKWS